MPRLDQPRPFRFAVNLTAAATDADWRAKCRRAEVLGYDVILVPDHLGKVGPGHRLCAVGARPGGAALRLAR
jgi:alkanesulfonate monooxygenase SsuD/methylene tetrahydromethanopterin reductase-like flavin-dependent oxidoreductase (luciferase family)